jgi:D-serine deaminase-like pyridoxal phosphate-dependent protein
MKARFKRWWWVALVAVALVVGWVLWQRPADLGGGYSPAHQALNEELRRVVPGSNVALVDLDTLDQNAARIREQVGDQVALRLVTKSLPSLELVAYLAERVKTRRLMVFSEPYLDALLRSELADYDMLLGKPVPAAAADRLLTAHEGAVEVRWLVDHPERLEAYLEVARLHEVVLRLAVEIDVGLRRGGAPDPETLVALLDTIAANPQHARFAGLMGYDGHVPHAPAPLANPDGEFEAVHARYTAFVEAAKAAHPSLFGDDTLYDSGGSLTYPRYDATFSASPVNEISVGSAFLAPTHFADLGHKPATWLAAPVLKKLPEPELPFREGVGRHLDWWDPNLAVNFFLLGGGWPADPVSPPGLVRHPIFDTGHGVANMLPNQPLLCGSTRVTLEEGDFVFFHPWEGDGIVAIARLHVVRDGRIVDVWQTYTGAN